MTGEGALYSMPLPVHAARAGASLLKSAWTFSATTRATLLEELSELLCTFATMGLCVEAGFSTQETVFARPSEHCCVATILKLDTVGWAWASWSTDVAANIALNREDKTDGAFVIVAYCVTAVAAYYELVS